MPSGQAADKLLRVLEIDIPSDFSNGTYHGILPEGAPAVDGLVVCYDASDESTFAHVEAVLGKHITELPMFCALLTCSRICGAPETANCCICHEV